MVDYVTPMEFPPIKLSISVIYLMSNGSLQVTYRSLSSHKISGLTYSSSSYWLSSFYEPIHLTPFIFNVLFFCFWSNSYLVIPHYFYYYIFPSCLGRGSLQRSFLDVFFRLIRLLQTRPVRNSLFFFYYIYYMFTLE